MSEDAAQLRESLATYQVQLQQVRNGDSTFCLPQAHRCLVVGTI